MLAYDEEPCDGEYGCIRGIYDTINDVKPCKGKTLKRRLAANVRSEVCDKSEGEERVDVH